MEHKFSLNLTPEEGILLLTGARLLDKLVAGISIQAKDRDELIRDIIAKISTHIPPQLAGLSDEIAEAIVESVIGAIDLDEEDELAKQVAMSDMSEREIEDTNPACNYPMYAIDKTLPKLEKAIIEHNIVKVRYYSFARESVDTLTLHPFILMKEESLWKLVAFCLERNQPMLFRVDRIKEMLETSAHFYMPPDLNFKEQLPFAS